MSGAGASAILNQAHVTNASRTRRTARLIQAISARKHGITIRQLCAVTGGSRATIYRDIDLLKESGYALEVETVSGEARYSISGSELAQRSLSPREHAATALARRALSPLAGTLPVQELERLLARSRNEPIENLRIDIKGAVAGAHPDHLHAISDAVAAQRMLRLHYRGAKDDRPKPRRVHPIQIQVVDGTPYLIAWDEQAKAVRTFKAARITLAKKLREKCRVPAAALAPADPNARSVKVWTSHPIDVRVRIAKLAARFVTEWPLVPDQLLQDAPDGAVDVCARVYGVDETLRWVLRWGANACVLEPRELRERVVREMSEALAGYGTGLERASLLPVVTAIRRRRGRARATPR